MKAAVPRTIGSNPRRWCRDVTPRGVVRWLAATLVAALLSATFPSDAQAQQYTGYTPATTAAQAEFETALQDLIDTSAARTWSRILSAEPRIAGTSRQRWTAGFVDSLTTAWGLRSRLDSFLVYLPHPVSVSLARVSPDPRELTVTEPRLPQDPATHGTIFPAFNGYSGRGDVTAEIVYVNYGLMEDYAQLEQRGVSVAGKIAVARYGRSFRGIKAREAERHGAIGLVLYSDPADDGYVRGDVYPNGPFRPDFGVQRGSIKNGRGDPSTPTWASTFDAPRIAESEMVGIARIPVLPVGYASAAELLRLLGGADLPDQGWQGGLPFRYHVGPGPVTARLAVRTEAPTAALHPIYNTIAVLEGRTRPDEWIVVGAHRDAWGPGATDNASGTASVLEMARAFATLAARDRRPERTIVFATWDAEEWGLIGSWEWVEQSADELRAKVVAYVNQDAVASGSRFGASAAGTLKSLVRETMGAVPDPFGEFATVYERWTAQHPERPVPPVGDLGGGSDFAGFYNLLGIGAVNLGFGGPGGVYHSAYDSYRWMSEFGDPAYAAHVGAARAAGTVVARLANAEILPFDYAGFAAQLRALVEDIDHDLETLDWSADVGPLLHAIEVFGNVAEAFSSARASATRNNGDPQWAALNRALLEVEKTLTRPTGLRDRPWMRNLMFAADRDNGYGNMPLPSIREPLRDGDAATVEAEIRDLVARVDQAADALRAALALLRDAAADGS